eukprot:7310_1
MTTQNSHIHITLLSKSHIIWVQTHRYPKQQDNDTLSHYFYTNDYQWQSTQLICFSFYYYTIRWLFDCHALSQIFAHRPLLLYHAVHDFVAEEDDAFEE